MDCPSPGQEDGVSTEGDAQQNHVTGQELGQGLLLLGETGAREAHCLLEAQESKGSSGSPGGVKDRKG